jgi:hypothetical protein
MVTAAAENPSAATQEGVPPENLVHREITEVRALPGKRHQPC